MMAIPGEGFSHLPDQPVHATHPSIDEAEALRTMEVVLDEIAFASTAIFMRWYGFQTDSGKSVEVKAHIAPRSEAMTLGCSIDGQKFEISQHEYNSDNYTLSLPPRVLSNPTENLLMPFLEVSPTKLPPGLGKLLAVLDRTQATGLAEDSTSIPLDTDFVRELWADLNDDADTLHVPTMYRINSTYAGDTGKWVSITATTDSANKSGNYVPPEEKLMQSIRIRTAGIPTGDLTFVREVYDGRLMNYYFIDMPIATLTPEECEANPYEVLPDLIVNPAGSLQIAYYLCQTDRDPLGNPSSLPVRHFNTPYTNEAEAQSEADTIRAFELAKERANKAGVSSYQLERVVGALMLALEITQEDQKKFQEDYNTDE